jgi:hypothetical protein
MGMKCNLLALSPGVPRDDLAAHAPASQDVARRVAEALLPGRVGAPLREGSILEDSLPPADQLFVGVFGPTVVLASEDFEAFAHVARAGDAQGRTAYHLMMHSVSDAAGITVCDARGEVVREVVLGADMDRAEVEAGLIGQPLPFERPFWAGERPLDLLPGEASDPDDLPFWPMDFGEEALRWAFGFVGEGEPRSDDLDGFAIPLHGFDLLAARRSLWKRLFG